jgi:uncharacterized protein YfiM (DUF2279 family)
LLRRNEHHSRKLQASYNKHGADLFVMRVVEIVSHVVFIQAREQYWIERYGFKKTYNTAPVAMGATRIAMPVYSIDPSTGQVTAYKSAEMAAAATIGTATKSAKIRRAIYTVRRARGRYWTAIEGETLSELLARKQKKKTQGKVASVFAFNLEGELVNAFPTIATAAKHYGVTSTVICQAISNSNYRTAAGLLWNNQQVPKCVKSRKTKRVLQKQNGATVAVWDSVTEAAQAIAGTTVKGISGAATGYTKSHRGYQWEFAKS